MNDRSKGLLIILSGMAAVIVVSAVAALMSGGDRDKKLADANHELLLAKQARDFKDSCTPALNQRTTIRWKQDGLFCIKQEWNGKRLIEVEVKRVETVEGFLAYPLGRKE